MYSPDLARLGIVKKSTKNLDECETVASGDASSYYIIISKIFLFFLAFVPKVTHFKTSMWNNDFQLFLADYSN